ncbi:MAG: tetratricopeptide (TPR) repeat protein [Polyangiales bacterium]|jgi:tetratricopeptide (TPR) repeat protein
MDELDRGEELRRQATILRSEDRSAAGALYLEARELFQGAGAFASAGMCTLAMAQMAAEDFDLETAHYLGLLAADGLAGAPDTQHKAYMIAGRAALASGADEDARNCFLAATDGPLAWQALEALASIEFERGNLLGAEECLREAWSRLPADGPAVAVALLRERFGDLAFKRGDTVSAIISYRSAVASLARCPAAESQLMRARLITDIGDLQASMGAVRDALQSYETVREYYVSANLLRRSERINDRIAALTWRRSG